MLEPYRIDGTIGVSIEALYDLQNTRAAKSSQRLCIRMLVARLG
jgi:hypothetical protein